jgi:hypothetical protein
VARGRIRRLVAAGLVDSFGLALAWTTFNLYAAAHGGLEAVGFYGAALLAGIALSAPATSTLCRRLTGRRLLRAASVAEAAARSGSLVLLFLGASPLLIATCVVVSGLTAWTSFATMRAEVAAARPGPRALTMYMGSIAAVEAAGAAVAALIPEEAVATLAGPGFVAIVAAAAVSLVPTFFVARHARVGKARKTKRVRSTVDLGPLVAGFLVMLFAAAPTFLAVALSSQLHGRRAVAVAAAGFMAGAVAAPAFASLLERMRLPAPALWPALGVMMIVGWVAAPSQLLGLVIAQFLSGLALSTFEGTMDARVLRGPLVLGTASLAEAAAARALGAAVAVASAPVLIESAGLPAFSLVAAGILAFAALVAAVHFAFRRSRVAGTAAASAAQGEALSAG